MRAPIIHSFSKSMAPRQATGFLRTCRKACRSGAEGRNEQSRRLWEQALRMAYRMGCPRSTRLALKGIAGTPVDPGRDLPATPAISRARPARGQDAFLFQGGGLSVILGSRGLEGFLRFKPLDLLVDGARHAIRLGEKSLTMGGAEIPMGLLMAMVRSAGEVVPSPDLFREAWGRACRTKHDLHALYFHMHRLRTLLSPHFSEGGGIQFSSGGYRLDPSLRTGLIQPLRAPRVRRRSPDVLAAIRARGRIDNRTYRELTGASTSTAFRELQRLIDQGVLRRIGFGRAAYYLVIKESGTR